MVEQPSEFTERLRAILPVVVSSFCHELHNSLTVASARVELTMSGAINLSHLAEVKKLMLQMRGASQRLHLFVRALRFDDLHVTGMPLEPAAIEQFLVKLVQVHADLEPTVAVSPKVRRPIEVPPIFLERLVSPLLENIAGIADNIGRRINIRVDIGLVEPEDLLEIRVSDDGPGWGDKLQGILVRASSDLWSSDAPESKGRGLQTVYWMAKLLHGGMKLRESVSGGAEIEIVIPLR